MYEEFLQKVPLFAELPWEDLTMLCQMVEEVRLRAGELLFEEGSAADKAYILHDGELEVTRQVDGRVVYIDRQVRPGTVIGEMALLEEGVRLATIRARRDSFLLGLDRTQVYELLGKSPTATKVMFRTLSHRSQGVEAIVRYNQQMAQLGTLTAGVAHELNNPVAAVTRGADQLQALLADSEQARVALDRLSLAAEQEAKVADLVRLIQKAAASPPALDALKRSDQEAEVERWLDGQAIADVWEMTPALVNLGLGPAELGELATIFAPEQLPAVLRWLCLSYTSHHLLSEIMEGAGRIAQMVKALKSYVYLDQAPVQRVDIHSSLENTLTILQNKLGPAVQVRREYAPDLPPIMAYASDLNQVWTNILDNAAWALQSQGQGEIVIRTRQEGEEVVVEIEDNGPGIAPAHLPKIFDPFFTTKPPGKGSGLGLNISYHTVQRHLGEIEATSQPGRTLFQVRLPLDFQQVAQRSNK